MTEHKKRVLLQPTIYTNYIAKVVVAVVVVVVLVSGGELLDRGLYHLGPLPRKVIVEKIH